jgi:hypothetical protein
VPTPFIPDRASFYTIANAFRFIGMFMAIMGLIVLGGSAIWYGTALQTTGGQIGTVRDRAGNENAVVRFIDGVGDEHEVEVRRAAGTASSGTGRRLPLLYHQENPKRVVVDGFFEKWFLGGFLLAWGAFLWWILTLAARRLSQEQQRSEQGGDGDA